MFALTQGLRRAVQIRPNGPSTAFASPAADLGADARPGGPGRRRAFGLDVQRGDRVAILALNSDRYFELMYALPWIGAVMVPLNTRLAAPEIEYILEDFRRRGPVRRCRDGPPPDRARRQDPGVREVIWLDDIASPDGMLHYEDLTAYEPTDDVGAANDDLAGLFYTGGTTGRSKGVMLTHTNLVVNAMNAVAGMGFTADTAYIHSGAMFHLADGASTFGVTLAGGRHSLRAALRAGRGAADHRHARRSRTRSSCRP